MKKKIRQMSFILSIALFFFGIKNIQASSGSFTYQSSTTNFVVEGTATDNKFSWKVTLPNVNGIVVNESPAFSDFLTDGKLDCNNEKIQKIYLKAINAEKTPPVYSIFLTSQGGDNEYEMTLNADKCTVDNSENADPNTEPQPQKEKIKDCVYNNTYAIHTYKTGEKYSVEAEKLTDSNINVVVPGTLAGAFQSTCPTIYVSTSNMMGAKYESVSLIFVLGATKYEGDNPSGDNGTQEELYTDDGQCDYLLGDPENSEDVAYWLQFILDIIKYAAIVALLAFSTLDFIKALVADDKDALKKAGTKTMKRFVFAVLIFFLPIIVEVIMKVFGAYGTCNIR